MALTERQILDALPLSVVVVDPDGRVIAVHGAALPAARAGAALADVLPIDRAALLDAITSIRDGHRHAVVLRTISDAGEPARLVRLVPASSTDATDAFLALVEPAGDAGARGGTGAAVAHAAAGFARELRGPLAGIASAAQLLRFRMREDPVVEKNVGRLLREAERLGRLASALAEYGRAEPLALAAGDPEAVWDQVIEDLRGEMESRALKLDRVRAHGHPRCRIDAERLAAAFSTLLANAVAHAPEASDLALVGEVGPDGGWRCRLTNGGEPMSAEARERAFELFFSTRPGASGLGLPLARRIVEEHGGTLSLASGAEGTTAAVSLPPVPAAPRATHRA